MTNSFSPPPLPNEPMFGMPDRPTTRKSGSRWLLFSLLGCGGLLGICMLAVIGVLLWLGTASPDVPDTAIIPGAQVPDTFMKFVRGTGVLEPGEQLLFFYSDQFAVEDGFYLLTDRKVVLYDATWEKPKVLVPFGEIKDLNAEWSDNFFVDSSIHITLLDGTLLVMPASSEYDRDELLYNTLREKWQAATAGGASDLAAPGQSN